MRAVLPPVVRHTRTSTGIAPDWRFILVSLLGLQTVVQAGNICVQFDAPPRIACRDVTDDAFRRSCHDERLVEARFRVSSLVRNGDPNHVIEYLYRVQSLERSALFVDYAPQTSLAAAIDGNVEVESSNERSKSLGVGITLNYQDLVSANSTAATGSKLGETFRYQLLPPLRTLIASGTIQRGTGVYFKLQASPRAPLEGTKEFALVLRVPADWRGDYLRLTCLARVMKGRELATACGSASFLLALHDERDSIARAAAERLVAAEVALLSEVAAYDQRIDRSKFPDWLHEWAVAWCRKAPRIPEGWLNGIYFSPADSNPTDSDPQLPDEVREAAREFRNAKRELHALNGTRQT